MKKLDIELNVLSNSEHISGIISGFKLLQSYGKINLKINKLSNNLSKEYPHECLVEAIINNKIKIAYDLLDGYNLNFKEVDKYLEKIDFYFKRSFSKEKNNLFINKEKIYPLGFNYCVNLKETVCGCLHDKLKYIYKLLIRKKSNLYVEDFELRPSYNINCKPKVIFCTRLWNPEGEENEKILDDKLKAERKYINDLRVDIIKKLKLLLNEDFIGGVSDTLYARENYPDLIINKEITQKRNYLRNMQNADICIGSMGLHESIGWKTAEYIASSKAIINEKFRYEVIGEFNEFKNYLSFETSDECINHIKNLINNPEDILKMQINNFIYYNKYLRPDMQVFNSLMKALDIYNQ